MDEEKLKDFNLVGGTALALQIGHRVSVDIDLFGQAEFEEIDILDILAKFGDNKLIKKSNNIIISSLNGIKVDIVNYRYNWIGRTQIIQGVRFASFEDIAAMKLNAIAGRGSVKDFIDLFFLLEKFTIPEMLEFYNKKYPDGSEFMVLKSLTFFDDADKEEMPILFHDIKWQEIKLQILSAIDKM
jgi:hypothetical protein